VHPPSTLQLVTVAAPTARGRRSIDGRFRDQVRRQSRDRDGGRIGHRPRDSDTAWFPPILLLVVAVGFTVYCLVDIARAAAVRYLSKWAWVLICLISEPLGGIVYLIVGRDNRARP